MMESSLNWKHERAYLTVSLLLLFVLYTPYWLQGQDAFFLIHDFLDDSSYNFAPLLLSGQAFNFQPNATVPNIMNGLPRPAMHSGLNASVWFFAFLKPFWAILVNFLVVHALGLVGMFALLRTYILRAQHESLVAAGIALIFALIPTYTNYGLSVMGQPLLVLAFLNLLNRRGNWASWLIILAFPFYSFLVRSGLYILVGLGILGLVDLIKTRHVNTLYWTGLFLLAGLYVLADFPMIGAYLTNSFVSHRTEYDPAVLVSSGLFDGLKNAVLLFVQGQYHTGVFCPLPIAGLWVWWFIRAKQKMALPFWLMFVIIAICLLHGLYPWLLTRSGIPQKLLTVFQLDRFYFLLPLLWIVMLGMLYNPTPTETSDCPHPQGETKEPLKFSLSLWMSGVVLLLTLALNTEWRANVLTLCGFDRKPNQPSYRAFFAENLFTQIKNSLPGTPADYRVVSIGMHPIVAQTNGFYTLDSYQNNYPLAYKHQFRQIVADEWAKPAAQKIKPYFDAYGNRCYIFPVELGMNCLIGKSEIRAVQDLRFNTATFRAMGGRYIFSAVSIKNAAKLGWRQVGVFNDPASYWQVWVYKVG